MLKWWTEVLRVDDRIRCKYVRSLIGTAFVIYSERENWNYIGIV